MKGEAIKLYSDTPLCSKNKENTSSMQSKHNYDFILFLVWNDRQTPMSQCLFYLQNVG